MRRDSIFYKLFQQSPTLLFELLTNPPSNADAYRFDSVASSVSVLPLSDLEDLSEALLDFTSLADLQAWLDK
jgi:hypothetical protein